MGDGGGGGGGGGDFGAVDDRKFSAASTVSGAISHDAFMDITGRTPLIKRSTRKERRLVVVIVLLIIVILILIILIAVYGSRYNKLKHKPDVCLTEECVVSAAMLVDSMDTEVSPCENFYQFACGRWGDAHPLPDFGITLDWYALAEQDKMRGVKENLQKSSTDDDPAILVDLRKLYATCADTTLADADSVKPLLQLLTALQLRTPPPSGGNRTAPSANWTLTDSLSAAHARGLPLLLALDVAAEPSDRSRAHLCVAPPKLKGFLPGYPLYEERVGRRVAPRRPPADIQRLVARAARADGAPAPAPPADAKGAAAAAADVRYAAKTMAVMRALGHISAGGDVKTAQLALRVQDYYDAAQAVVDFEQSLETLVQNVTAENTDDWFLASIEELQEVWDNATSGQTDDWLELNWQDFLEAVLQDASVATREAKQVLVASRAFLEQLAALLDETGADTVADYMWWAVVRSLGPYTSLTLREIKEEYLNIVHREFTAPVRSTFCARSMYKLLPDVASFGVMSAEEMLNATNAVRTMMADISSAFEASLRAQRWLDAQTRDAALRKVRAVRMLVGGPPHLADWFDTDEYYANLTLHDDTFLDDLLAIIDFRYNKKLQRLNNKHHLTDWDDDTGPLDANAFYSLEENAILVPFGIVDYPFSKLGLEALDYGFLGATLGHELTHGFDNDGRQFDEGGNVRNWWSNASAAAYEERAQCFVQHYAHYNIPFLDVPVDGEKTLGENIADNGGLTAALGALRRALGRRGRGARARALPAFEGLSEEQLFFLAYALSWCESSTSEGALSLLADTHSPNPVRLLASLKNSKEFARAWGCSAGSGMAPADNDRCSIW